MKTKHAAGSLEKLTLIAVVSVMTLLAVQSSKAATIVDTGPGPSSSGGWTVNQNVWLAAKFNVPNAVTITEIDAWLLNAFAGDVRFSLYSGGAIPENLIASTTFNVSTVFSLDYWIRATSLHWSVGPGDYWVAFEVPTGSGFGGIMPHPSENPLATYALFFEGTWRDVSLIGLPLDFLDLGIRIFGETSSELVPCAGPVSGSPWKNHGQYVSAAIRAANALVAAGLITEAQAEALVGEAARSDCGKD